MKIPQPQRWLAGEEVDADTLNARASEMLEFLLEPPQAMARNAVAQSIPNATWTVVDLTVTDKDNDGIVNLSTNKFTIVTPGWYEVIAGVGFASVSAATDHVDRRIAGIRLNGSTTYGGLRGRRDTIPDRTTARSCRTGGCLHAMFLNEGDYIELMAYQASGVARNTYVAELSAQSLLQVRWVSN